VAERSGDTAFECRQRSKSGVAFHFPPQSKTGVRYQLRWVNMRLPAVKDVPPQINQAARMSGLDNFAWNKRLL
jgi:hypothetical protein